MVAASRGPSLVVLGRQGSGKGTQAQRVAAAFGLRHLSTGAMLREAVAHRTPLGRRVQRYLVQGRLVPDELMVGVVESAIGARDVVRSGFLLDGFPRTRRQADDLERVLDPARLDAAVLLDVPLDVVRHRLGLRRVCRRCETPTVAQHGEDELVCAVCGGQAVRRDDDTPEAIEARLETHELEAAPLLRWFEDRGLLLRVDAVGSPDEVFERVHAAVAPVLAASSPEPTE